jgi:hypothetical protein
VLPDTLGEGSMAMSMQQIFPGGTGGASASHTAPVHAQDRHLAAPC